MNLVDIYNSNVASQHRTIKLISDKFEEYIINNYVASVHARGGTGGGGQISFTLGSSDVSPEFLRMVRGDYHG